MSTKSTILPRVLDNSGNSIFFENPPELYINEELVTRSATSHKIETLIKELQEKGPLVGLGKFGPSTYVEASFKLRDKVCNQDIYGWKPGAQRNDHPPQSCVLLLGAKKSNDREHVYFTMSDDFTLDRKTYIREHKPSETDPKVYIMSHKTFSNYLSDLYPPTTSHNTFSNYKEVYHISSRPKISPELSVSEREYAEKLSAIIPLDSILDEGEGESKCKAIGQEIFDKYKGENGGNSLAGKDAVQRICDAVVFIASDGALRKQYIERAWNKIGDDNWRWRA